MFRIRGSGHKVLAIAQGAFIEGACKRQDVPRPAAAMEAAAAPADETSGGPAKTEEVAPEPASSESDDSVQRLQAVS